MNYESEIKAFYGWLITNNVPADAQALWHVLMYVRGQCKQEEFKVDNPILLAMLNISSAQLARMRLILIQKQRIIYKKQSGRQSGIYKILLFASHNDKQDLASHNEKQTEKQPVTQTENKKKFASHNEKQSTPFTKEIIDYYHQKFLDKFGEKPAINGGKDGAIIKRLLSTYGDEKLKGLLDAFFESDDSFINNSGYSIGVFSTVINKLITNLNKKDSGVKPNGTNRPNTDQYNNWFKKPPGTNAG